MYSVLDTASRVNFTFVRTPGEDLQISFAADSEITIGYTYPELVTSTMREGSYEAFSDKIANYSFVCTVIVVWSFSCMISQIRIISQNFPMRKQISLLSVSISLVWNFFFFSMHF